MTLRAKACLEEVLSLVKPGRVLDVGCGGEPHRRHFEQRGFIWTGRDLDGERGAYNPTGRFDLVWASHVLEHLRDPILHLRVWHGQLEPGGLLAVTVPLRKDEIVGGHINLYNAGLLIYHAVLAGFDCSECRVATLGKEVSLIVRRPVRDVQLPKLKHDRGDIQALAQLLPPPCRRHGFDGMIGEWNW